MSSDLSSQRLERLEERLAWFERHAVEQDKVMLEMAETLKTLETRIASLENSGNQGRASAGELDLDERPPHY